MKLSIITINYNNKAGLEKTIESVMSQTWRSLTPSPSPEGEGSPWEWIIIDGGSTDGSKEVIEELSKNPNSNISYWCSEPDKGIYNAMNKGIAKAKGEYLQFLNSGDCLLDKNVINDFFLLDFEEDIISGNIAVDGSIENGRQVPDEIEIDFEYMKEKTILHPSSFIRKDLFSKCGYYDENYRIVSDWKFFLIALIQYNCSYRKWYRYVADFSTGGISESKEMFDIQMKERSDVLNSFLPRVQRTVNRKNAKIKEIDLPIILILKNKVLNKTYKFVRHLDSAFCKLYLSCKGYHFKKNSKSERIIVSMTSWKKRINNVSNTINSIVENSFRPDLIVLNLSLEEFPNKEKDLPDEILQFQKDKILEIEWVKGNTKAFKKIIPTLRKYPNDAIICIDDDFIYPKDFISTFVEAHKRYPANPLSGNLATIADVQAHCGCASLVKAEYYGPYLNDFLDDEIIKMGMDDVYYTFCASMNNCFYRYVGKLYTINMESNNPIDGLSSQKQYSNLDMLYYLIDKGVKEYHISWGRMNAPVFKF